MRTAHERQEDEGAAGTEQDGMRRVAFYRSRQGGSRRHHQGDPADLEEPQQDQVGQEDVARGLVHDAVDGEEGRPVRRLGPGPRRVSQGVERSGPEYLGSIVVGVDVVAHHLALGGVGVHVATEERRREQQRDRPDHDDEHDLLHREARPAPQGAEQAQPDPGEQDEPTEDERERRRGRQRRAAAGAAEESSRHTEEPRSREVGLERGPAQDGADSDGGGAERAQNGRAGQTAARGPVPARRRGGPPVSWSRGVACLGSRAPSGSLTRAAGRAPARSHRNRHRTAVILSQMESAGVAPSGSSRGPPAALGESQPRPSSTR